MTPRFLRRYLLILSTVLVMAVADPKSILTLTIMTATVVGASHVHGRLRHESLLAGVFAILLALLLFKILGADASSESVIDRMVPLGLSYYSLRCIHLLIEQYLGRVPRSDALQTVEYLFFPATIIAGPIHRYPEFIAEAHSELKFDQLPEALERILYGYAKIVVLSNYVLSYKLFPLLMSSAESSTALYQYLDSLNYGLTLYLQFSGYSDIAIGFALLLGHRVIENFSWPYLKSNIVEFWRSWHISLTRLCREYVFTSVHAATRQAWLGVIATMLAISLWHGVTMNYLAWGIYHAAGLLVYRLWSGSSMSVRITDALPSAIGKLIGWALTFQFVMLGFIWTKEETFADSLTAWQQIFVALFPDV